MNSAQLNRVHHLWDELALHTATDTRGACNHLMRTVGQWIDADKAGWIGTIRLINGPIARSDPLLGWRQKEIQFLQPPSETELKRTLHGNPLPEAGMTSRAMAQRAGTFRVNRLRNGFVDFNAFQKTSHYEQYYSQIGVTDRLWLGCPSSPDAESFFIFDRRHRSRRFTRADAMLAGYAVRGLTWFHRQLLLCYGLLLTHSPLTPTERIILPLLLTDKSEKQLAAVMKQSGYTTHDHIQQIFRKYGISGRTALMALWLSHH